MSEELQPLSPHEQLAGIINKANKMQVLIDIAYLFTTYATENQIENLFAILFLGTALGQEENSSTDSQIAITSANFVAPSPEKENLNEEWVEVSNNGSSEANLTGWTLEDAQNHTYTIPDFNLKAGAKANIRTGIGMN